MRVVVTGAAGRIGRAFTGSPAPPGWEVVVIDRVATGTIELLDVTDPRACHRVLRRPMPSSTWRRDPATSADFRTSVLPLNMVGTDNIVAAAVDEAWAASCSPAASRPSPGYPLDVQVREDDPPRLANDYGVGKAFGEALCAAMVVRSTTTFLSVRIGYAPVDDAFVEADGARRRWCHRVAPARGHRQSIPRCVHPRAGGAFVQWLSSALTR